MTLPRLYGELADWWHLLSDPSDYREEATIFTETFEEHAPAPIRTMLELGSGGGNNASHMKRRYELTLTDLSSRMLEQSKRINPECKHIEGDMRTLRLGRSFDAVFVHDAVAYMKTEADLLDAMRTAYEHLARPGIALFVPDDTLETIERTAFEGGHDAGDRALRYLYHQEPPRRGRTTYQTTFTYVIKEAGAERIETDVHVFGVFPHDTWMRLLSEAGLEPKAVPYHHSTFRRPKTMFVGLKPV